MSGDRPTIIDAHVMLGEETYLSLTPDELLRRMDDAGVDQAIARPMGAGLVVDHVTGNDLVLGAGPRVRALVSANPWWGRSALGPHHGLALTIARTRDPAPNTRSFPAT